MRDGGREGGGESEGREKGICTVIQIICIYCTYMYVHMYMYCTCVYMQVWYVHVHVYACTAWVRVPPEAALLSLLGKKKSCLRVSLLAFALSL